MIRLSFLCENQDQQPDPIPDWLKQLSCYAEYAACTSRTEKLGIIFRAWERDDLSADEMRLLNYLEHELGAPITKPTNQPIG
jgi:hypothetical protein